MTQIPFPSDEHLMQRAKAGDVPAFGLLFDRHQPRLVAFLRRFFGGDAATAEDVAQDAFWRAWEHRAAYDADRPFALWFYTIAKNAALNELKKPARSRTVPLSDWSGDANERAPLFSATCSPGTLSLRDQVRRALEALPPDQRLCLILREYEGWSHREAAQILGCSEGAARVLAHRARRALRNLLGPVLESQDEREDSTESENCCVG